jgi:hypothetical protein
VAVVLQPAAVHQLLGTLAACNKLTLRESEVLDLLATGWPASRSPVSWPSHRSPSTGTCIRCTESAGSPGEKSFSDA